MIVDQFNTSDKKETHNSAIKSLQQKILDTNFNEPRSLISGLGGSSKKRKIMGLPFNYNNSDKKKTLEEAEMSIPLMGSGLKAVPESYEIKKAIMGIRQNLGITKMVVGGDIVLSNPAFKIPALASAEKPRFNPGSLKESI